MSGWRTGCRNPGQKWSWRISRRSVLGGAQCLLGFSDRKTSTTTSRAPKGAEQTAMSIQISDRSVTRNVKDLSFDFFVRKELNADWALQLGDLVEHGVEMDPIYITRENKVIDGRHRLGPQDHDKSPENRGNIVQAATELALDLRLLGELVRLHAMPTVDHLVLTGDVDLIHLDAMLDEIAELKRPVRVEFLADEEVETEILDIACHRTIRDLNAHGCLLRALRRSACCCRCLPV